MHWPGPWAEYPRGVHIAQLQHLKHLALSVSVLYVDGMSDFSVMTALEKLTVAAEVVLAPEEHEEPPRASVVDASALRDIPNLHHVAFLGLLQAEFEYEDADDDVDVVVLGDADIAALTAKGCTTQLTGRPTDEFWLSME